MPLVRGNIAQRRVENGELKDVPVTDEIRIMQTPSTIDR